MIFFLFCLCPVKLKLCTIINFVKQIITIFNSYTYSRDIDMFPDFIKKKTSFNVGLFEHYLSESFHILYAYNFSWGLPIRTRFDDLDHVSRPQVYE